jgi:hypothetical protein
LQLNWLIGKIMRFRVAIWRLQVAEMRKSAAKRQKTRHKVLRIDGRFV